MEGVAVGVQVHRIEVEDRPDIVAEKRQVQVEAGAEHDPVELLGVPVGECHGRVRDGFHPRTHRDSALCHERQVLLVEGDPGGEERRVGRRSAVLLGASARLDHDLLQLAVDLRVRERLVRRGCRTA